MSKYYLVEKKSGLGVFTIDFILFFIFALGFGLNIILALLAAMGVSVILFLLMTIPYFGRVVVCACGGVSTMFLYSIIDGLTGWLSGLRSSNPVQWWLTVILSTLFIIFLHWIACPSPHSNGTILGDDEVTLNNNVIYPSESASTYTQSSDVQISDVVGVFNQTKEHFSNILDRLESYNGNIPPELVNVLQNAKEQYDVLENRMRSYMDLYNDSSASWRNEVGADILKKAEKANDAINQLESAYRLLNQTSENKSSSQASYFRGCKTLDELNKRYRNLTKTFHPDLEAGDEETMKQINEEYERLKKEFVSNT